MEYGRTGYEEGEETMHEYHHSRQLVPSNAGLKRGIWRRLKDTVKEKVLRKSLADKKDDLRALPVSEFSGSDRPAAPEMHPEKISRGDGVLYEGEREVEDGGLIESEEFKEQERAVPQSRQYEEAHNKPPAPFQREERPKRHPSSREIEAESLDLSAHQGFGFMEKASKEADRSSEWYEELESGSRISVKSIGGTYHGDWLTKDQSSLNSILPTEWSSILDKRSTSRWRQRLRELVSAKSAGTKIDSLSSPSTEVVPLQAFVLAVVHILKIMLAIPLLAFLCYFTEMIMFPDATTSSPFTDLMMDKYDETVALQAAMALIPGSLQPYVYSFLLSHSRIRSIILPLVAYVGVVFQQYTPYLPLFVPLAAFLYLQVKVEPSLIMALQRRLVRSSDDVGESSAQIKALVMKHAVEIVSCLMILITFGLTSRKLGNSTSALATLVSLGFALFELSRLHSPSSSSLHDEVDEENYRKLREYFIFFNFLKSDLIYSSTFCLVPRCMLLT